MIGRGVYSGYPVGSTRILDWTGLWILDWTLDWTLIFLAGVKWSGPLLKNQEPGASL